MFKTIFLKRRDVKLEAGVGSRPKRSQGRNGNKYNKKYNVYMHKICKELIK